MQIECGQKAIDFYCPADAERKYEPGLNGTRVFIAIRITLKKPMQQYFAFRSDQCENAPKTIEIHFHLYFNSKVGIFQKAQT